MLNYLSWPNRLTINFSIITLNLNTYQLKFFQLCTLVSYIFMHLLTHYPVLLHITCYRWSRVLVLFSLRTWMWLKSFCISMEPCFRSFLYFWYCCHWCIPITGCHIATSVLEFDCEIVKSVCRLEISSSKPIMVTTCKVEL